VHVPSVAKLTDSISNSRFDFFFFFFTPRRLDVSSLVSSFLFRDVRSFLQVLGRPHHHNDIQLRRTVYTVHNALDVSIDFSAFFFSLHVSSNWSSRDFTLNSPY
jgi:hypothetical protein